MPKPKGDGSASGTGRGLTTAQLAARVGFTNEGSMRNIENRSDTTSEIKLHRIARELGVAVDELHAVEEWVDGLRFGRPDR